ncbi:GNAT family N-acetyltransferase [Amycolatopsis echigonensis]|uniref:GNAT family N-acetyltransferase n=1 Tax=Amycolatopsis echigonensis TaxID=2576905 RepID=A0A2N3WHX9_9PSEU|nr:MULTISPECIES: GNAT family protein [Amycolatopsis]MBB2503171.1 GNAT family N-acetyltransferase [Amycolatopsis echigonensis]PKV93480.1 RimJ/RimL family protein N-acetyltransferase [Amycolatopsis niigatensis]
MTWSEHPILSGRHVRLEPLSLDHAPGLLEAGADPGIWAWLSVRQPADLGEAETMVKNALADPDRRPWAQIDLASGRVAGTTSYYQVVAKHRILSIGHTWIGAEFQRTALNTEAKFLLLRNAFEDWGAQRVAWETDNRNLRSQRAIERLGALREGVLRAHRIRPDGTTRDTVLYSMTDAEWPGARARLLARLG